MSGRARIVDCKSRTSSCCCKLYWEAWAPNSPWLFFYLPSTQTVDPPNRWGGLLLVGCPKRHFQKMDTNVGWSIFRNFPFYLLWFSRYVDLSGPPKSYFFYESDPKASHWSANNIHAVATKGLNSAIQHPWLSFAMSTPLKRSSAQRTEAFNFQIMFVQSFSYVNENDATHRASDDAMSARTLWRPARAAWLAGVATAS